MIINYHEISSMPVLSSNEGKDLGMIQQPVIDLTKDRIVGFIIQKETGESVILTIQNIDSFGPDCIMASSENSILNMDALKEVGDNIALGENIFGLQIVTERGEIIGEIGSLCFEENSGKITHFITSEGLLNDLVHGKGLLAQEGVKSFSRDALVVTTVSAELANIMKTSPGLKHKANSIVGKAETTLKDAKEKVETVFKG